LLGGRWTLATLEQLTHNGGRDQDLHETLDGISHKVFTETLSRRERDPAIAALGFITCNARPEVSIGDLRTLERSVRGDRNVVVPRWLGAMPPHQPVSRACQRSARGTAQTPPSPRLRSVHDRPGTREVACKCEGSRGLLAVERPPGPRLCSRQRHRICSSRGAKD
jgi:HxlR-like helix-turn-helix